MSKRARILVFLTATGLIAAALALSSPADAASPQTSNLENRIVLIG